MTIAEREREIDPGWKLLPCCSKKVITGWKKEKVSQAESPWKARTEGQEGQDCIDR